MYMLYRNIPGLVEGYDVNFMRITNETLAVYSLLGLPAEVNSRTVTFHR